MKELKLVEARPGDNCYFVHHDPIDINDLMGPMPEICSVKYRRHFHRLEMPVRACFKTKWMITGIDTPYHMYAEICLEEGILYYNWGTVPDNKVLRWRMMYFLAHGLRNTYGKDWKLGPRKKLPRTHRIHREIDRRELESSEYPRYAQRRYF